MDYSSRRMGAETGERKRCDRLDSRSLAGSGRWAKPVKNGQQQQISQGSWKARAEHIERGRDELKVTGDQRGVETLQGEATESEPPPARARHRF